MTKKQLNDSLRLNFMQKVHTMFENEQEEVLIVGSNEIAIPCLDAEGNEEFMVITFKVPTGSHDGDAYDGYAVAESYQMKLKEKEEKAQKAKAELEKKKVRDAKKREQVAQAKQERKQIRW